MLHFLSPGNIGPQPASYDRLRNTSTIGADKLKKQTNLLEEIAVPTMKAEEMTCEIKDFRWPNRNFSADKIKPQFRAND